MAMALWAQVKKPWHVDRLCGRAQYVKRIPEKKNPNIYSDERTDLKTIRLDLYESIEGMPCCDGLKMSDTTISGKRGQFELKPDHAGNYWLVAKWNEKGYALPVIYEPQKKSATVCSEQGIQIEDDGDASWWETVTVD
jgi:hypothetical protein